MGLLAAVKRRTIVSLTILWIIGACNGKNSAFDKHKFWAIVFGVGVLFDIGQALFSLEK